MVPIYQEKEKKTLKTSINRAYLRNAAVVITTIMLFFALSTPVKNIDVQENNYAQLLPSGLFERIEKQSVMVTFVYVKNDATQQAKKLSASSVSTKTSSARKHTTDKAKTSEPIAAGEVKVVRQEATAPAPVVKSQESANHLFHIIMAGGISLKDIEVIANQLKSEGFVDTKTLNTDGKVRVSISSFNNRDEAIKQLLELRKNETYKNAWLLTE